MDNQDEPRDPRTAIRQPRLIEEYFSRKPSRYLPESILQIIDNDVNRSVHEVDLLDGPAPNPPPLHLKGPMQAHPFDTEKCSPDLKRLVDVLGSVGRGIRVEKKQKN